MRASFLLYGANGFVGEAVARLAVQEGLAPTIAGRDVAAIERLGRELGTTLRVFSLDDTVKLDAAVHAVHVVLNCAGPFMRTARQMAESCLRGGTHYLDITGEIPVYQDLASRDADARARGVMLLPGIGFDVVPTDCLAVHLKRRLPSATRLTLAFGMRGPSRLPPGTQRTMIELAHHGILVRRNGRLEPPARRMKTLMADFGRGPRQASLLTWGDVFTAYRSTGIPNIEVYAALSGALRAQLLAAAYLKPLFKPAVIRRLLQRTVTRGATPDERARTTAHVWGRVEDDAGGSAVSRLHGPEATVEWTARAALAGVRRVLAGDAPAGYKTPAGAYGADFVMEVPGVAREDVS
ncbi:MAG: saccharopine dehydrogenase family protein [Gemmatimonadaceae bacterium]